MASSQRVYVRSFGSISAGPVTEAGEAPAQADVILAPGCGLPAAGDQSPDDARDPLGDVTDGRR